MLVGCYILSSCITYRKDETERNEYIAFSIVRVLSNSFDSAECYLTIKVAVRNL